MPLNLIYSAAGLALTKKYEGLRLSAYKDTGGIWTVGYGHTGADVGEGRIVTEAEAEALLRHDVRDAVASVNAHVRVPIIQNEFDALVDFAYNAGTGSFYSSRLLSLVNENDLAGAGEQFGQWIYCRGKVLPGLVRRRAAEAAMFRGVYRSDS